MQAPLVETAKSTTSPGLASANGATTAGVESKCNNAKKSQQIRAFKEPPANEGWKAGHGTKLKRHQKPQSLPFQEQAESSKSPDKLTNRLAAAASSWRDYSDLQSENDPVITYHVLTSHYRESWRLFAVPHLKLSRLQTRNYYMPAVKNWMNLDTPTTFPSFEHAHSIIEHMLWLCSANSLAGPTTEDSQCKAIIGPGTSLQVFDCQRNHVESSRASRVPADSP
ncbi:hypothetical protein HPB50_023196 [Hyalomma asiaticum]|uniref:Uncharacterized protein n=1 Tax=Hyalomma asiaticum TaxID=266040 RepID=A0ACB7RYN3_HYAAI|nr:hypothetical protein HPB50_023196 [Hyalomma asiaticum]